MNGVNKVMKLYMLTVYKSLKTSMTEEVQETEPQGVELPSLCSTDG